MRKYVLFPALLLLFLTACSGGTQTESTSIHNTVSTPSAQEEEAASQLTVCFGDNGASFVLYLEDNDTAKAIARHVGSADWRLPIYHFDDYDGWESFQYYDVPSRYEIPSNAETVASESAGQVYYSEPNRIVLFYHDAEISGEYTYVGHIEATEDFVAAVENNPVLEGWRNKIVTIRPGA